MKQDRWGARSLGESMLTLGNAFCSSRSAVYSVLTCYHPNSRPPETSFLHSRLPPGADPDGNIKGLGLVGDLRRRQGRRLACSGTNDPHSKLPRLLDLKSTTGDFWNRPDMTVGHHVVTSRHWLTQVRAHGPEVDGSLMNKVSHVSLSRVWRVCLLHVSCVDCIFFFVLDSTE